MKEDQYCNTGYCLSAPLGCSNKRLCPKQPLAQHEKEEIDLLDSFEPICFNPSMFGDCSNCVYFEECEK